MKEFYKKKLKNGLTVLFEKRNLPVISVSASVKYGSAYENEKNKGISHLIEHMMFKGTKTRSQKEIAGEIEKKGGIINAFTADEITSYWNKLPSKHISTGIEIASDLILNPRFDEKEFEKERNVVIEEIKMYHDNPQYYVIEKIRELLYKKPFGMFGAGNVESVKAITRRQMADLFNKMYSTDSMILSVVGNSDFDFICKKAEQIFPVKTRKVIDYKPVKINRELIEARRGIDQAHFVFGFHINSMKGNARYADEIACAYLFGGMSSRLFQEIRVRRALAYTVKGDIDLGKDFGYSVIYVGTMKEKIKQIKEIILKEVKNLGKMQKKDFEECKEQLIGMKNVIDEDSSMAMNSLMLEEVAGNAEEYYKYEERIKNVKLEDVRKLAKLKDYSTFSLVPK